MTDTEATIWGIHGGKTGDADTLFLKENLIAVGWTNMPDLSTLPADREAFKESLIAHHPDTKPGAVPTNAGQLFRFVHEMKRNDLIVYPSKRDRKVHIGRVVGDYRFDRKKEPGYPHQRPVQWLRAVPRTTFSQGALYEIGSAMSLFQVKNYADEFRAALSGQKPSPVSDEDATVALIAEEVEEATRDFILKKLAQQLKGHPFAQFIAHMLNLMGYKTRVSPEGTDGGVDIIAHRDELGFEPPIVKVQVKSGEGSVGDPTVSSLYGKISSGEYGLFVTLGTFTAQAKGFAKSKSNLRLIDGDELVELVLSFYDRFDSRYKGLLPLRKVYIPEALEEE